MQENHYSWQKEGVRLHLFGILYHWDKKAQPRKRGTLLTDGQGSPSELPLLFWLTLAFIFTFMEHFPRNLLRST